MKHRWPTGSKMSGIWLPSAKAKHRFFHTTEYALPACSGITHRIGEHSQMYDIHIILSNTPGSLGAMGIALGNNGVGLEGGGVFTTPDAGHAHFLVEDGETARRVLTEAGFTVSDVCRPLIRKLPQNAPGNWETLPTPLPATVLIFWYSTATTVTGSFFLPMMTPGQRK